MVGLAKACEAVLGTAQAVAGFTLAPTAPASLSAVLGPGQVFQQAQLEATPFSTLPADGHTVVKQGILLDAQTLTFTPPAAAGYAQNFLVEVQYQDADAGATVLPYYNAVNPQVGFSGPGGAGTAQNTVRRGAVAYQIKAGVAATAGTQTSPAPDAGWAGLYVVTLAQGATTITAGNITLYAGAPFIPVTLPGVPRGVQSGQWEFGVASGTNAYTVALSPAPLVRPQGMEILVYIPPGQANTGAATLNDGLGLVPFVRQGGGALASGDVSGFVPIVFDGANWRVNGPVASDILALILANGLVGRTQTFFTSGTFTVPPNVTSVRVEMLGGGGAGGATNNSTAGGTLVGNNGSGGGAGGYCYANFTGLTPGATYAVTVGPGGLAVANAAGGNGGTTSFGALCSATGGAGGVFGSGSSAYGGAGGLGSGGQINLSGGQGGASGPNTATVTTSMLLVIFARGGLAPRGLGSIDLCNTGGAGQGYGNGGSASSGGSGIAGGNGAPGICIVSW